MIRVYDNHIKFLITDIIITVFVVLFTIPVWYTFNVDKSIMLEKSVDNLIDYEFLNGEVVYKNEFISDDDALRNVETQNIIVNNYYDQAYDYKLILKINKKENIDSLKININYEISYLNSFDYYEDNDFYYYILKDKNIEYESHKYVISMWNSAIDNASNEDIDSKLIVG